MGEPKASASAEMGFSGGFSIIGHDLVDGRRFATEAASSAVLLAQSRLILEPVISDLAEAGILDEETTFGELGVKVKAQLVPGTQNLLIQATDDEESRASAIAEATANELISYFEASTPALPDGSPAFTVSLASEVEIDEPAPDHLSLVALPLMVGLLVAGISIALVPLLRRSVHDEATLASVVRRAFGSSAGITTLPADARRSDETLGAWLALLVAGRPRLESANASLVAGCGPATRTLAVAEAMAAELRRGGREAVTVDLDRLKKDGEQSIGAIPGTLTKTAAPTGPFLVLFSSRLGKDPSLASLAAAADEVVVVVERGEAPQTDLLSGLEAMAVVGRIPATVALVG